MVFHSFLFLLLFLPAVVIVNWMVRVRGEPADRKRFILITSILFYGLASLQTLPILLGSLAMNWFLARHIQRTTPAPLRRRWLVVGISLNIALLLLFKYTHFLAESVGGFLGWRLDLPSFMLPLGISFFTIQQIIYLVDCYEEMIFPAPLLDHAVFISFFPYIAAGPIARAGNVLPQFDSNQPPDEKQITIGLMIFIAGLCKKVLLADTFGPIADSGFAASGSLGLMEGWITALTYTLQLYFDFSGYSDMAIGTALMLGLRLPENFNSPLKAVSLIDFWKRWHMTLTGFITTYLYTPLARGMQPLTFSKAMLITIIAMTISGFWHGAAWTFLVWGFLHGAGIVANHMWRKTKLKLPWPLAWGLTFTFVIGCGVVFRADGLSQAREVWSSMAGAKGIDLHGVFNPHLPQRIIMLVGVAIALLAPNTKELAPHFNSSWRWTIAFGVLLMACLLFMSTGSTTSNIYRGF